MAMHDPQAHFGGLISFSGMFLLGILIWLHNPLWIISFACTTTLRDFSILQAITTLVFTIDICICIFQMITVQSTRQEISFYSFLFPSFISLVHNHMSCAPSPSPSPSPTHTHTFTPWTPHSSSYQSSKDSSEQFVVPSLHNTKYHSDIY